MTEIPLLRGFAATLTIVLAGLIAAYWLLPHEDLIVILVVVLAIEPFVAALGTAYQWTIWLRDKHRPRSWLLFWFAMLSTLITVGLLIPAWLALRRQLGGESLNPIDSGILLAVAIAIIGSVPAHIAVLFWWVRRGRHGPPPFSETD